MKVDIIVPTYNRPDDLRKFIVEISKQNYPELNVYIIDDNSTLSYEGSIPATNTFSYEKLRENKGQAYARNLAITKGNGDIVISLDDDAWFEDDKALERVVEYFRNNSSLGCLMFNIKEPSNDYISVIRNLNENQQIGSHITCGCAYRRTALEKVDGFSGFLHSGAEETDLSLKLIRNKYTIEFSERIKVFHNYIPTIRTNEWYVRLRHNITRNDLLIVLMRYPVLYILPYLIGKYLSHILYSLTNPRCRVKATVATINSLITFILYIPTALKHRKPLSTVEFHRWLKIKW